MLEEVDLPFLLHVKLVCVELCHSELFQLFPVLGDEVELTSEGSMKHGLWHIKQVTDGGDSAGPSVPQPPCFCLLGTFLSSALLGHGHHWVKADLLRPQLSPEISE